MKKSFVIITCILFCSCYVSKERFSYNTSRNAWIKAYRDKVFISCLKKSYTNDSIFHMMDKEDLFNPYDGFYGDDYFINKTDSLGKIIASRIPKNKDNDAQNKNYYMCTCLKYYDSYELDSISKKDYKIYVKRNKDFE